MEAIPGSSLFNLETRTLLVERTEEMEGTSLSSPLLALSSTNLSALADSSPARLPSSLPSFSK